MRYEEFINFVVNKLKETVDDNHKVNYQKVMKNNDTELDSICIMEKDSKIAPTIYLNQYYDDFVAGESIDDIISEILKVSQTKGPANFAAVDMLDYEYARDKIMFKLVNRKSNEKRLKSIVYKDYLDMAITYFVLISRDDKGNASATITNQMLEHWNVTIEEIDTQAKINSQRVLPAVIQSMSNIVMELVECDNLKDEMEFQQYMNEPEDPMYVISNNSKINGAAAILYDGILEKFANKHKLDKIIILPSSIHECILLCQYNEDNKADIANMVKEVNSTSVSREEVLSDSVYVYDKATGEISIL